MSKFSTKNEIIYTKNAISFGLFQKIYTFAIAFI